MLPFFFIARRKRAILGTFPSRNANCPRCKERNFLEISIYQRFLQIYLIPTFPTRKTADAKCSNCGYDDRIYKKSESLTREFYFLKDKVKTPIWTWTGAFLFIVLAGLLTIALINNSKKEQLRVTSPLVSDVYYYLNGEGRYTSMIAVKVSNDSIWFCSNDREIKLGRRVKRRDLGYLFNYKDTIGFSRNEVLEKYQDKFFKRVERRKIKLPKVSE